MAPRKQKNESRWITPLGIVAAFVTLTESVLGIALTQVSGGVQIALTVFVIVFALLVAFAFFLILWFRPFVFYSPSEFGDHNPKEFIDAFSNFPKRVKEQIDIVEKIESSPTDQIAQFKLINSLIDDVTRQFIILMNDKNLELPISDFKECRYEIGDSGKGTHSSGVISSGKLCNILSGTGLIELGDHGLTLSKSGIDFANWLGKMDLRSTFLKSSWGEWGQPFNVDDLFKTFTEAHIKQYASSNNPSPKKKESVVNDEAEDN